MKKTLLLLVSVFSTLMLSAQSTVISNGEDTGLGWWQAGSTAVEIVDWHPKEGNPSAKCMTIWISTNSDAWSGGGLGGLNIDVNTYNTISVLVYKNVAGTVRLELQDGTTNYFTTENYTTPGVWQKLDFSIPAEMTNNITTLLIAPFIDYDLSTIVGEQSRCFWDEVIAFNDTTTGVTNIFSESIDNVVRTDIYSMTGNLIKSQFGAKAFDYTTLNKSMYLIKQTTESGKVITKKIAIRK